MLLLGLILFCCAAWFSEGYINHDEHFQVIEFLGVKLGKVDPASLTWEYFTQSRSWFPAALFYVPAKIQMWLGDENPVHMVRAFRFVSGLLGFSSVVLLYLSCRRNIQSHAYQIFFLSMLLFLCIMPSYHVRTSSENLSGCFIVLATSLVFLNDAFKQATLFAGVFAAMAFHCRYQVGIMVAGQAIWLLFNYRLSSRVWYYAAGLFLGLGLGVVVDIWGWGGFHLTAWNYLRIQLLEGKVNTFGTSPWYDYFLLLWNDIPKPFGPLLFATMVLFWVKCRRSLLTWMTLPFVMVHFMIGHKEVRFLIPALYFAPLMLVELLESLGAPRVKAVVERSSFKLVAALLLALNFGFLIKETFVPKTPAIAFIEEVYERQAKELVWSEENPYFYMPLAMRFYQLPRLIDLRAAGSLPESERILYYQRVTKGKWSESPCGPSFCLEECVGVRTSPFYQPWLNKNQWAQAYDKSQLRILSSCRWRAAGG